MTNYERDLKSELEELKKLTEELREVKDNRSDDMCPDCRMYASVAFTTAEKYYEILMRAEMVEATWYKKGGIDCEKIVCDCKEELEKLKNKKER